MGDILLTCGGWGRCWIWHPAGRPCRVQDLLIEGLLKVRSKKKGIGAADAEPGAAGIFAELQQAEHCVEGAADGDDDVCGGAIFYADHHAAGNDDGAGGARPGIGRGDFQDRASLLGEPARRDAAGRADDVARERPPVGVSAARQRVSRGDGGGSERGPRDDHPSICIVRKSPAGRAMRRKRWRRCGRRCRSDGEIVLESTPNGAGGVFYEEWQRAEETGYTRHFFPWWYEDEYRVEAQL